MRWPRASTLAITLFISPGGNSINDAFTVLRTIIAERRLIAGNGMIKGGYRCVCFTEAPLMAFRRDFVSRIPFTRYFQFGLLFE